MNRSLKNVGWGIKLGQPTQTKISHEYVIKKRWLRTVCRRQPTHTKISHEYVIKKRSLRTSLGQPMQLKISSECTIKKNIDGICLAKLSGNRFFYYLIWNHRVTKWMSLKWPEILKKSPRKTYKNITSRRRN